MRIVVNEFIESDNIYSVNLKETKFKFEDTMAEVANYVAETQESFQGKLADKVREMIQTRFEGLYSKYIDIDELMINAIADIATRCVYLFGSDGVVDTECIEEIRALKQREIYESIKLFEEVNRTLVSVGDIVDLGRIETRDLEELQYKHTEYCNQVISDAFEFDEYIKEKMQFVHEAIYDIRNEFGINIGSSIKNDINFAKQSLNDNFSNEDTAIIIEKAEEDFKDGKITKEDLEKIKEAVLSNLWAIIRASIMQYGADKLVSSGFAGVINWFRNNTNYFVNSGLVLAPANGGNAIKSVPPSTFAAGIRNFAKYGLPIVGAAVDFGIQVHQGEDVEDAAIKAVVHTGVMMGTAKVGALIGVKVGGAIGSVVPGAGTVAGAVVGGVVGFIAGVAINMAFDAVYDAVHDDVKDFVIEEAKEAGKTIKGFFLGAINIFG